MRRLLLFSVAFIISLAVFGQMIPPNARIIYFGDSQTSFSYNSTDNSVQFQNFGYVPWLMSLCPALTMPKGGMLAVPGETTNHMVNRLGPIATFNAKLMVVMAGTNDPLYAISPATTKANLRKIYDAGIAAGIKVIAIPILPRFAQNTYSPPVEAARIGINDWIKSQADIVVVDAENALNSAEYFEDGLHTSPAGAFILGKKVAEAVNKLVVPCLPGSANAAQLTVSANSNPLMAGTGGRFSNATGATNTSGVVANGWLLAGNFAGTATVTGSKEAAENGREKQVITISGNYTGNSRRVTFNNYATAPIALYGGQVVEGVAEIELPFPLENIRSMYLKLQAYAPEYASTLAEAYSMFPTSNKSLVMEPGRYLMRTPPMTIDPGTVGQLTTQIVIEFNGASSTETVALTMKISSIGIRQLPLAPGPQASVSSSGGLSLCPGKTLLLNAGTGDGYNYQWYLNETAVQDSTRAIFTASEPGSYKVQVSKPGCMVASEPVVLSSADCMVNAITTDSLPADLCTGQALAVPFSVSGQFDTANVFSVQLSDGAGSFTNPQNIGTIKGRTSGTIQSLIPTGVVPGTGYRIRVTSSSPVIVGTAAPEAVSISATPDAKIDPADSVSTFPHLPVTLTAFPQGTCAYQWLLENNRITQNGTELTYTTSQPGNYRVIVVSENGCADTSSVTRVKLLACSNITVSIGNQNDSTLTLNARGGMPPYQYSLDSSNYQFSNVFKNLPSGRDYTVYVKDSVNCTGQLAFTLRRQSEYETQDGSGSRNTLLITQRLGSTPGIVVFTYDMLTRPDLMEIYFENELKATTGGPVSGRGWLWFDHQPSAQGPYECGIRMHAPEGGAEWAYTPLRPISQFQAMRTGFDTVTATTFVSPNFPNATPANTTLVHRFTPAISGSRLRVDFKALLLDHGILSVYDGADTTAPLLATYTGLYGQDQHLSLTANNPSGQLTFKFVNSDMAGRFGWVANLYSPSGIRTFYPKTATAGDTVTIVGDGFYNVSSVRFGEQNAHSFEVVSDTLIRAVVAGGKSGNVEVNASGQIVIASGFVFHSEIQPCPGNTQLLNAPITGSTYQWQVSPGNGSFTDIQDGELYNGTTSATLQIPNISSSFSGYQYRCVVNGVASDVQTLKFINTWVGGQGTAWETAANWSCGMVPDAGIDVVIPAGSQAVVNVSTTIRNLKLQKDAMLTIKPDVRLQVGK